MKSIDIKFAYVIFICIIALGNSSCKKDFLDAKPSTNLLLLNSLSDCQTLLNNTTILNQTGSLAIAASDEYWIPDYNIFLTFEKQTTRNSYVWAKDLYSNEVPVKDWNVLYSAVFYANSILETLPKIDRQGTSEWNQVKGWALFARAFAFYDLAQSFCKVYDVSSSAADKGIPLRLQAGIDDLLPRASLQATYNQILSDLKLSRRLFHNDLSIEFRNQPSRAAVFALFSRIYLSMSDYKNAEAYADSCLTITNKLIDYNSVSTSSINPFNFSNEETIYHSTQVNDYNEVITATDGKYSITPELLSLYNPNDLRKSIFFRINTNGTVVMKRGYSGRSNYFTGLATDEIYLIKAECAVRRADMATSLDYLNQLLTKRYKTGTFSPIYDKDQGEVLELVLKERKKELVRRGLRWSDLKRLNHAGANITLVRILNGQTYQLPPNDPRYEFPIPFDEVSFSGIEQNQR